MDKILTTTDGIGIALHTNGNDMKKTRQILKPRARLSLGDLIFAVSSCAGNSKETIATVAELFASGQVRLQDKGRFLRARVC